MKQFNRWLAMTMAALLGITVNCSQALQTLSAPIDVIVSLDAPDEVNAGDFAYRFADRIEDRFPAVEVGYIYDTLLCGVHLTLPGDLVDVIGTLEYVESVSVCQKYEALEAIPSDKAFNSASKLIGYSENIASEFDGSNVKVAVLDSGFDVTHPAFSGEGIMPALDLQEIENAKPVNRLYAMRYANTANEFYVNDKIPFCFDYAGVDFDVSSDSFHGTHVAGIIGAQKTELSDMHGIAPGCQLLLMKVFDDDGFTSDQILISAMEDALKLGADVVNLSLGTYAGSANSSAVVSMDQILRKMESRGCMVVCAVGNDSVSTERSEIAGTTALPPASYTDFGTLSSPAASSYAFSAASADNAYNFVSYIRHEPSDSKILFTDTNLAFGILDRSFTEYFDGQEIEYEVIGGIGSLDDYSGTDLSTKIALIERGTITFVEKINNAADHGAIGVIIYNDIENEDISLDLTGAKIPAIAISKKDGQMLAASDEKILRFDTDHIYLEDLATNGKISAFSSRGVTPSLTLKPDITTVGGQVLSTVNNGKYAASSGTSMAAPQLSGTCALMIEKLRSEGSIEAEHIVPYVRSALMNTAVPILQENGVEYSVRTQGAGLANIGAALSRELAIAYKPSGLPKAELYDLIGDHVYLDLELANITDKPLTITVSATLSTDGYKKLKVNGESHYFNSLEAVADTASRISVDGNANINRNSPNYTPLSLQIAPGETVTLPLMIDFDKTYHDKLAKIFTNGHFFDGYVYFKTDSSSYSIPYMGYMGDWGAAPVLDGSYYTDDLTLFGGTAFVTNAESGYVILETPDSGADIAFSPNNDGTGDTLLFRANHLRNVRSCDISIKDTNGELLYKNGVGYQTKSHGIGMPAVYPIGWSGDDGLRSRYHFPDGIYTLEIEYDLDYQTGNTQKYSYKVRIDTQKPELSDISYENGKLTITADDISLIKTIYICENSSPTAFSAMITDSNTAVFDLSGYNGDTLYYEIIDHALNSLVGKVDLRKLGTN